MAVRITAPSSFKYHYFDSDTYGTSNNLYLFTNYPLTPGSITISFDGVSGSSVFPATNKVNVTMNGETTSTTGTSRNIPFDVSSFDASQVFLDSYDPDQSPVISGLRGGFIIRPCYTQYGLTYYFADAVYLNGVYLGGARKEGEVLGGVRIYVILNRNYYAYADSIANAIPVNNSGYHGYFVAGISKISLPSIHVKNNISNDDNNTFDVKVDNLATTKIDDQTYQYNPSSVLTPSETDYIQTYNIAVTNKRSTTFTNQKTCSVKGYHLPRLVVNSSLGNNSYVSRCDAQGNADGLGEYGHLHLKWEVSPIDPNNPNILRTCTVVLNNTTTLAVTGGSISDGYLDYIFPLGIETQGNLTITLADDLRTNTITSMVVPKGSMPMSLFDDGNEIGVAYGRMATQGGVWMYLPFYLQSSTSGSSKMFRIKVDDSGNISAELVS